MSTRHSGPTTGQTAGINQDAVRHLETKLRGKLIRPGDASYEAAHKVYNAMIDRHPALIAQCVDAADVMLCINFARENGVTPAVRCGGHNAAGLGVCDNGLVIDLSPMKGVRVNPAGRTVQVSGGCVWGDVDHATHAFNLAVPSGIVSTTGVGGLTLGGGHGYLTRKYGLTIDSLMSVDMVLADGSFVTANEKENPDLFWAVRGGGGNFGVVTSFLFRAHPVGTVYAGPTLWPIEQAGEAMRWYRDFIMKAPEDMYGFFMFLQVPPGPPFPEHLHRKTMCAAMWCYLGPMEQAEQEFAPIRRFGPPAFEHLGPVPLPVLNSMYDPLYPPGLLWYWKGHFVKELSDEAVDVYVKYGSTIPTLISGLHLYPIDAAAARIGKNDTAFNYRDARWSATMAGIDPDPANRDRITAWAKDYWEALRPYSMAGAYVNFMMEEGQERVKATYRDNYDRLSRIKAKYDPQNLFHVNQNIQPAH